MRIIIIQECPGCLDDIINVCGLRLYGVKDIGEGEPVALHHLNTAVVERQLQRTIQ